MRISIILTALALTACGAQSSNPFDRDTTLDLVEALSADALEGRAAGTEGNADARAMIIDRMETLGLSPIGESFEHPFTYGSFRTPEGASAVPDKPGINVMGLSEGTAETNLTMVITAHFDHLGIRDGEIYNGADDNASGVAGMLAIAEHFSHNRPTHDVLFVAF
ncbi:MAG: M28 family peptidase, partial [Pseudomonadota bacterium]